MFAVNAVDDAFVKFAVVANKLVEVEFANIAEAEYRFAIFAPLAERFVVDALNRFAFNAVKLVVLAVIALNVLAKNKVDDELVNTPFVLVRLPMNAFASVAPTAEIFVVDAFTKVV